MTPCPYRSSTSTPMRPYVTEGRAACKPSKISCLADSIAVTSAGSGSSFLTSNSVLPDEAR